MQRWDAAGFPSELCLHNDFMAIQSAWRAGLASALEQHDWAGLRCLLGNMCSHSAATLWVHTLNMSSPCAHGSVRCYHTMWCRTSARQALRVLNLSKLQHWSNSPLGHVLQADKLSPAVFAPVVRQFASARPMAVRHLAAQALVPLVTPGQLGAMLCDILQDIPSSPPILSHNKVRHLSGPMPILSHHCLQCSSIASLLYIESPMKARRKKAQSVQSAQSSLCMQSMKLPQVAPEVMVMKPPPYSLSMSESCIRLVIPCMQVHGSLLQVRHLLEAHAHAPSLQSSEVHAVLSETAALLLERAWLATPICTASAVRAQFLRAAGPLLTSAHSQSTDSRAVSALAGVLMGACQEALLVQEQSDNHSETGRQPMETAHAEREGMARALSDASRQNAVSDGCSNDRAAQAGGAELATAGADGADAMRSVLLKEAALLFFSPALRSLTVSGTAGLSPILGALISLLSLPSLPVPFHFACSSLLAYLRQMLITLSIFAVQAGARVRAAKKP